MKSNQSLIFFKLICAAIFMGVSGISLAIDYPVKSIEIVVPSSASGGTDALARLYADAAKKHLSQPIIISNKPGAAGAIGMKSVMTAPPDGYKMAMVVAALAILPNIGQAQWTVDDFKYVAKLNDDPSAITVKVDAPWKSIDEFLADAKKRPGEISVGNAGPGSIWHIATAALEDKTNVKLKHVPFQGSSPAVTALLGGHIDAVSVSPAEVAAQVNAGKLKILAIMSDKRIKGYESIPTLKERKIDLSIGTWRGLTLPKDTPNEIVDVLREATKKIIVEPSYIQGADRSGLGLAYLDGPDFKIFVDSNFQYFKELSPKLNIKN
jgi:tripartite-type tricarboxylate transporter receptor subunit TctC